jgi:uncharacterized protein
MTAPKSIAAAAGNAWAAALNVTEIVPSPCLSVCRMGAGTALCEGCFRTLGEITAWGQMDNAAKRAVWVLIAQREAAA